VSENGERAAAAKPYRLRLRLRLWLFQLSGRVGFEDGAFLTTVSYMASMAKERRRGLGLKPLSLGWRDCDF
jgi:hypothetical protein